MDDLLTARTLMATSLAFHMMFATVGIGMPLMMFISGLLYRRTKEPVYMEMSKRWSKGVAILFAVGAVSGTTLSFQLGMLWPKFMAEAGPIIGLPFALEGFAFFTEAIFLGIYLYGWERIPGRLHLFSGGMVALAGAMSGFFVLTANGFMQTPQGFTLMNGRLTDIDPVAAMFSPSMPHIVAHMLLCAYIATGFAMAGISAYFLLRDRGNLFHRRALALGLVVGGVAMVAQLAVGDWAAKQVFQLQPVKFAAMEAHFETQAGAPILLGGIPDSEAMTTRFAVPVPGALSWLATGDFSAEVPGLAEFPRDEWPNVTVTHLAFDIMVAVGMAMLAVSLWAGWLWLRTRRLPENRWLLRALVVTTPFGFIALQTGWIVTEVGRQPWIIQGIMRTSEAVTPVPGLWLPLLAFTAVHVLLSVVVVYLLRRQFLETAARPSAPDSAPDLEDLYAHT